MEATFMNTVWIYCCIHVYLLLNCGCNHFRCGKTATQTLQFKSTQLCFQWVVSKLQTPTWTCCCKQTEVWWPSGKAGPDWTLSMESSGWERVHTPHWAGSMTAGTTEGSGLTAGEGLSRRCPTLAEREGWASPYLWRNSRTVRVCFFFCRL